MAKGLTNPIQTIMIAMLLNSFAYQSVAQDKVPSEYEVLHLLLTGKPIAMNNMVAVDSISNDTIHLTIQHADKGQRLNLCMSEYIGDYESAGHVPYRDTDLIQVEVPTDSTIIIEEYHRAESGLLYGHPTVAISESLQVIKKERLRISKEFCHSAHFDYDTALECESSIDTIVLRDKPRPLTLLMRPKRPRNTTKTSSGEMEIVLLTIGNKKHVLFDDVLLSGNNYTAVKMGRRQYLVSILDSGGFARSYSIYFRNGVVKRYFILDANKKILHSFYMQRLRRPRKAVRLDSKQRANLVQWTE